MENNNPNANTLTEREIEILSLCAQGLTNGSIADKLVISRHTVKAHICNILYKLSATSRTHAVVIAERAGVLN